MRPRKPVVITWFCFNIFTSNLVKIVMQFSSKRFPMEMRESVVMPLKTWADCALEESLFDIFKVARKLGLVISPMAT